MPNIDYQTYLICMEALEAQLPHVNADKAANIRRALEVLKEIFNEGTK